MRDFEFELMSLIYRDDEVPDQEEIDEAIFEEIEEEIKCSSSL